MRNGPATRLRSPLDRDERIALAGTVALLAITAAWWALAFWPVADGPAWLERTRYVCFGVRDNGLPDAGGWVGLIGSPLGMFGILLVGWRSGMGRLFRRVRTTPVLAGAAVLGLAAGVPGGLFLARQARAADAVPEPVAALSATEHARLDEEAPALTLVAHDGVQRSLADLRGRPVLVTFAFGHCETLCPLVVGQVLAAQASLAGSAASPAVLIVTVDPWRDVPSRLPSMAAAWHLPARDAWVLGGDVATVEATLDAWRVPRDRDLRTGDVTHPALVYVIDAAGRIAFATTGGTAILRGLVDRL